MSKIILTEAIQNGISDVEKRKETYSEEYKIIQEEANEKIRKDLQRYKETYRKIKRGQ